MENSVLNILIQKLHGNGKNYVSGLTAAAKPFFISLLSELTNRSVLYITSDFSNSEIAADSASVFSGEASVMFFYLSDNEDDASCLFNIPDRRIIAATDISSFLKKLPSPSVLNEKKLSLKKGESLELETLSERFFNEGFKRVPWTEKRKEFSVRGGVVDVYPISGPPLRIEFFADIIDSIRAFDIETQKSVDVLNEVSIIFSPQSDNSAYMTDFFPDDTIIVIDEPSLLKLAALENSEWEYLLSKDDLALDEEPVFREAVDADKLMKDFNARLNGRSVVCFADFGEVAEHHFDFSHSPYFGRNIDEFTSFIKNSAVSVRFLIVSPQANRLVEVLSGEDISVTRFLSGNESLEQYFSVSTKAALVKKNLTEGFCWDGLFYVITDSELFGAKRRNTKKKDRKIPIKLEDLQEGDYVVHSSYGIGLYHGLETKSTEGVKKEFLKIEYAGGDLLYLPIDRIYLIEKYAQFEDIKPSLSNMNGREWRKTKTKVKEETEKLAAALLDLYAKRSSASGFAFSKDVPWQKEMEDSFPFEETPEQLKAIEAAKRDMESPRPMERLICGDAGYGKTEVALRCAFKAVMDGKQVAVLAPTTLLAEQHFAVFSERFASFPIHIELLSRFKTKTRQAETVLKTALGEVDIVIGTHRLLSKDVSFKDLGLVIIDEEQYFGVLHKEKLKKMAAGVDSLILSATPIPRTLNLTMSGIKDLSVISTPPQDRLPVKTYIMPFRSDLIKGALMREKARGGQAFFLHNKIDGIEAVAKDIENLIPGIRVAFAHAQMTEAKLEKIMREFIEGDYDVLVCTTIIQSGIDMPNVNTIIINNAYNFGLAQLYQIRGRVGRSSRQAYAYLIYPRHRLLTDEAKKRMEILRDFTELGSGFHVAMKDLEMRGAGDILGKSQHGFMRSVGMGLYLRMLSDAVSKLKGEPNDDALQGDPDIDLPVSAYIPDSYISDSRQKLTMYRKLAAVSVKSDLDNLKLELKDRFGRLPEEVYNLMDIVRVKLILKELYIPKLGYMAKDIYMLIPFADLSKSQIARMYKLGTPFGIDGNRLTLHGLLKDEYWMELLIEFLEFCLKIKENFYKKNEISIRL